MNKRRNVTAALTSLFLILNFIPFSPLFADTQRVTEYEYDGAGNIIAVISGKNFAAPDVTNLSPGFVNIGNNAFITATGTNLFNAAVTSNSTDLNIINVTNVSATEINLLISIEGTATQGLAGLTFSTRLGSDIENIVIADQVPIISTDPNPIVLEANNQARTTTLLFDAPFATDQIFNVAIIDTTIATIAQPSVTLLAGTTEVSLDVTGVLTGTTTLNITQAANFLSSEIPVIVEDPFQLEPGNKIFASRPLGVTRIATPDSYAVEQVSSSVGVVRTAPDALAGGIEIISGDLGVATFPIADSLTPSSVVAGTTETIIITGASLDLVTSVSFVVADDITQTAPFAVNINATQLTIFIDVAAGAAIGTRQIILGTDNGDVIFSQPSGDVLTITN